MSKSEKSKNSKVSSTKRRKMAIYHTMSKAELKEELK